MQLIVLLASSDSFCKTNTSDFDQNLTGNDMRKRYKKAVCGNQTKNNNNNNNGNNKNNNNHLGSKKKSYYMMMDALADKPKSLHSFITISFAINKTSSSPALFYNDLNACKKGQPSRFFTQFFAT